MFRVITALCCIYSAYSSVVPKGNAVVAYLPEWRYEGANWDTIFQTVTHLLLFSLEMAANGKIIAKDRIPRPELMTEAQAARDRHGRKLLICFGGNGRSAGYGPMVASKQARKSFLKQLRKLIATYKLDGVDYNWEYPGFTFSKGYNTEQTEKDYSGFYKLLQETRKALGPDKVITLAYYPDKLQEKRLSVPVVSANVDYFHAMAYDQSGKHSTFEFAEEVVAAAKKLFPPDIRHKVTLGVPFYARSQQGGDWTTYEDLVQKHWPLDPEVNEIFPDYFNGVALIRAKTKLAKRAGLGGVMIWEVGQDCRRVAVTHGETTHAVTCPSEEASLLRAIHQALAEETLQDDDAVRPDTSVAPDQLHSEL
eukprot:gb/GEZN01010767.1/.p1 GENE.gb/GEZN01010767.1/~~gb/GEZN01010767.1/.p1  ORF type:complete len:365 (+),score=53.77 gb/GEZN01010767.1/:25-1119(+)